MPYLLEPSSIPRREKRNLTDQERLQILEILLSKSASGKLKRGCLKEVAAMFSVDPRTISAILQRANSCIAKGLTVDVSPNLRGRVGRKRVQLDINTISALKFTERTNIRSIAEAIHVPKTTLHRRVKDGVLRPHTNALKPLLSEEVLPAIRAKWPRGNGIETILIQQDNARPHIHEFDAEFLEEASKDGFDIRLVFQPPNSPDLNVLDLGFFRAIQTLQYQQAPKNVDELVSAVMRAFEELPSERLENVFLTLQACMIEIMKVNGGIGYKVPHIGKGGLMRDGNLPTQLQCDHNLVESVLAHLHTGGN
ncbi:hypothetical protein Vadar_001315 [Vaccinium darrowii]|uniref:Uncharacterized protein n=1 Tax=Vaccinium darrowii TaxID=229202 RepID=A0ACB7YJG9_9ERIC|nr:hypothetical protein Vadar_001315 [Vaccinium darrowii]